MRIDRDLTKCTDCNLCLRHCEGASDPQAALRKSECFVCFNCIEDCPHDALTFRFLPSVGRAPFVLTRGMIANAFAEAESRGAFKLDDVSPVAAAARIRVPVLLVHGADDRETNADHSRRVYDALVGPKRLIVVPKAGHNRSLTDEVWTRIEEWVDRQVNGARRSALPG